MKPPPKHDQPMTGSSAGLYHRQINVSRAVLNHMSNEERVNWLFSVYRGWDTTQLCGDYRKRLSGSLLNHQDSMESKAIFFFYGSYLIGKLSSVLLKHLSERKSTSISTWKISISCSSGIRNALSDRKAWGLDYWVEGAAIVMHGFNGKSDMFIMNSR